MGSEKTYTRISECYYWPGLYSEVIRYVKNCETCQRTKTNNQTKIGLMGKRLIEEPWTTVAADIMGPLPLSKKGKNQYILVFVDLFTKWVEIIPIKKANGRTIESEFHKRIVSRWETPRILHTENGTELVNGTIRELTERFGIRHVKTPRYYPQKNPTERYYRIMKEIIRAYMKNDLTAWDENIDDLQFAINASKNTSTKYTPAFLNLGRELQPLQSLRKNIEKDDEIVYQDENKWTDRLRRLEVIKEEVQKNLDEANEKQATHYNLRRRPVEFKVGDKVLKIATKVSNKADSKTGKLFDKYEGPYIVKQKISPTIYELKNLNGKSVGEYNINDPKLESTNSNREK